MMIKTLLNSAKKIIPRSIYALVIRNLLRLFEKVLPRKFYRSILDAFLYIKSFQYTGNQYECPFCHGRFSKLLPTGGKFPVYKEKNIIGGGYRENASCPRCHSTDKERLVFLYIIKNRKSYLSKNIKLLHVAPEKNLSKYLRNKPNIEYLTSDLYNKFVDVKMDVTDIQMPDDSYEVIICNHVLEHVIEDQKAMKELFRILKKGGFAVLQVPISFSMDETYEDDSITDEKQREIHFGQNDHVRIYGKDYVKRLESAGFHVSVVDIEESLEPQEYIKYALNKNERIFVCEKL